jgi:hypothetical protein
LYDFYDEIQSSISETYKTINKSLRGKLLWQKVTNQEKAEVVQVVQEVRERQKEHQYKEEQHSEEDQSKTRLFKRIKF